MTPPSTATPPLGLAASRTVDPQGNAIHAVRPFLVWPVARREFYISISIALLPALLWSVMIFGFRAAEVIVCILAGATLAHKLLKRFTQRGKSLLYAHTLVSALVFAALCMPTWPPQIMLVAGAVLTGLLWIFEGPGRDRIHPSVVMALALGLVVMPLYYDYFQMKPSNSAVLARNRMFMGDIQQGATPTLAQWPRSGQIGGNDAAYMPRPATVLAKLIPQLHSLVTSKDEFNKNFDQTLVADLPNIDLLMLGVRPGYLGEVSSLGLLIGGMYLAYRNILRSRSVWLYFAAIVVGLLLLSIIPADFSHLTNRTGIASLWRGHVDKILALQFYQFFSGDILFAAVIILALPGTEPITPNGRRWMLILAGLITPLLQRADLHIPVATTVMLFLQPLNPLFDAYFARRSWLNP